MLCNKLPEALTRKRRAWLLLKIQHPPITILVFLNLKDVFSPMKSLSRYVFKTIWLLQFYVLVEACSAYLDIYAKIDSIPALKSLLRKNFTTSSLQSSTKKLWSALRSLKEFYLIVGI